MGVREKGSGEGGEGAENMSQVALAGLELKNLKLGSQA